MEREYYNNIYRGIVEGIRTHTKRKFYIYDKELVGDNNG